MGWIQDFEKGAGGGGGGGLKHGAFAHARIVFFPLFAYLNNVWKL